MNRPSRFNHVALLVRSVKQSAERFARLGCLVGPESEWAEGGTREIYIGEQSHSGRVLLMEPIAPGRYLRAMSSRGPGLHHVAIDVLNLEQFINEIACSGWYLHPRSLTTIRQTQTAWLARPGIPLLVEVQQEDAIELRPALCTKLELPFGHLKRGLIEALHVEEFTCSPDEDAWITLAEDRAAEQLLRSYPKWRSSKAEWTLPGPYAVGEFLAPVEQWRMMAAESER